MTSKLSVVICDDHKIVRSGLRRVLTEDDQIDVVSDVGSAAEVVAEVRNARPDIVVLDISLPDSNGISVIGQIAAVSPDTKVLILTMHDDVAYLREAFSAGAFGYVLKAAADVELIQAIHEIASGVRYVHPALGAALLGQDQKNAGGSGDLAALGLSPREVEILRLLALGYTNPEMADMTRLSVRTVETYRHRLQQKVGLRSRAELARLARESGLVG